MSHNYLNVATTNGSTKNLDLKIIFRKNMLKNSYIAKILFKFFKHVTANKKIRQKYFDECAKEQK
jgi:hypothetical protein